MGSFTDTQIQPFNPYVQQLPVDAMVKVGMAKQQQYDQGVQKIQGYIDNIAGMDVSRDVDKAHLKSKLDELGGKLRTVASGDFSNQQLVNSVGGMATQIVKDPFVQAAVYSTARIREQEKIKKQLEKEGKTDKNNDDFYNNTLNQYYQSGLKDANGKPISFNGEYIPYVNIVKEMKDALVNAGEDSSIAEQLFITDPETKKPMMFYKKGIDPTTKKEVNIPIGYKYADVKTIEKFTSNKPAVAAALDNVLQRGDVKRQLQIDGWANYRNVPVESLIEPFKKTFETQNLDLTEKGVEITAQLAGTNLSKEEKEKLTKTLEQINLAKAKNSQDFASLSEQALKNPESFKQNLYETQFRKNLLRQFTKEKSEVTTGVNEGKQQENWEKTYNFNVQKEATRINEANRNFGLETKKYRLRELEVMSGLIADPNSPTGYRPRTEEEKKAKTPLSPTDPIFNVNVPGEKPNSIQIVEDNITSLGNTKLSLAIDMYKDILSMYHKRPVSPEETMATIKKGADLTGETEEAWVTRQIKKLDKNHTALGIIPTPVLNSKLNKFAEADEQHLNAIVEYETAKKSVKQGKKITINNIEVDPGDIKDLIEFNKLKESITVGALAKAPIKTARYEELTNKLEKKYGNLVGMFGGKNYDVGVITDYEKQLSTKLEPLVGVTDKIAGTLSPDIKTKFLNSANLSTLTLGNRAAGPSSPGGKYDSETFNALLNQEGSTISWSITKPKNQFEDWAGGEIIVRGKDGTTMSVEATKKEIENLSEKTFGSYVNTPIFDRLSVFKTGSTNPSKIYTDPDAWTTSYFTTKKANPEVRKSGIEYHADVVPVDNGYKLAHYIKLPNEKDFSLHWDNQVFTGSREELEQRVNAAFFYTTPAMLKAKALEK